MQRGKTTSRTARMNRCSGASRSLACQKVLQLVLEPELPAQVAEQSVVPLLGGEVLADGGEVEDGDIEPSAAEPLGGADHQRGLAHLSGGEDVAELAALEAVVEVGVGLPGDVAGGVAAEGAAGDVERPDRAFITGVSPDIGIQLAAGADISPIESPARTPALRSRRKLSASGAGLAAEHAAHHFGQCGIAGDQDEEPAQVVVEEALFGTHLGR